MAKGSERNSLCWCNSGKKLKKCHGRWQPTPPAPAVLQAAMLEALRRESPEPNIDLVTSAVGNGTRIRVIWNRIFPRPASETFHEFLINVVMWTFGDRWWRSQLAMESERRHCVMRWHTGFRETIARWATKTVQTPNGTVYWSTASAPAKAILLLGYDLFCLSAINRLPEHLVSRIRNAKTFQAARYEICVAAIVARAGFTIEFLDDLVKSKKHCEFLARHKRTGTEIGVEAKSRVRPGSYHQPGTLEYDGDVAGLVNLVRKAERQGPTEAPLVIFLDVNVPPTPTVPVARKQWVRDAAEAAQQLDRRAARREDGCTRYSLLLATNLAFQFGDANDTVAPAEFGVLTPSNPQITIEHEIADAIVSSMLRYSEVPEEI
jgi:hypothetical protein